MLLLRLSIGVAYNFLDLLGVRNCAFFKVMGPLDKMQVIGAQFNKWIFPSLLCLMVLLTATNLIGWLLGCCGLKEYSLENEYVEEKVFAGRACVERFTKR